MIRICFFKKLTAALLTPALIVTSSSVILASDSESESIEAQSESAFASSSGTDAPYVEGEILITYQDDVSETQVEDAVEAQDGEIVEEVADLDEETVALVSISEDMTVSEAVESYQSDPAIAYAEPNYILEIYDDEETEDSESTDNQWYLDYVYAQEAWESLSGVSGEAVRVAVIDTGADLTHEDLANVINTELSVEIVRTMRRPWSYSYSTIQLRGDGYLNGSDTQNSSTTHGTHVTGILAAESGNGVGIQGTASGGTTPVSNQILDLVVIDAFASQDSTGEDVASVSEILYAMQYADDIGCRVINLSMGTTGESSSLKAMCTQLYEDGIVLVCAAGNSNSTEAVYPSDYDTTISVINITSAGERSSSSSYGDAKDLSAPGYRIYSTLNGGGYGYQSGTSMATPIVTSAAAMLLYADSDLDPSEVKTILCETATDLLDEGKDEETGYGAVNILAAVESVLPEQEESDDTEAYDSGETDDAENGSDEGDGSDEETSEDSQGEESDAGTADSLAVRRGNTYYFLYSLDSDEADLILSYGTSSDEVYIGDWDGDG
ncbi:MAG: S8 family serine peptidase, partial [Clostridiales bacterium]|nr:S8 family serine peptidase [Clostridiales bacterium]